MRVAKPSQEVLERKQQVKQLRQIKEQLLQRLRGKRKN